MEQKKIISKEKHQGSKISRLFHKKLLKNGKSSISWRLWTSSLEKFQRLNSTINPTGKLLNTLDKSAPMVDLKKIKVGKKIIKIPCPLKKEKRLSICLKWILSEVKKSSLKTKSFPEKLASILNNLHKKDSPIIIKKKEWHMQARKNARFLRYRWF